MTRRLQRMLNAVPVRSPEVMLMALAPGMVVPIFPPGPSTSFTRGLGLQDAMNRAAQMLADERRAADFRIAMIDLQGHGPYRWAALSGDDMDYIASEAKVVAMVAAYALRDMVRRFHSVRRTQRVVGSIASLVTGARPPREHPFFEELRAHVDERILASASPLLRGVGRHQLLPKYSSIFTVAKDTAPDFTNVFKEHIRKMIVPSDNASAGECVRGVGYAYMSGLMQYMGLFRQGIGPWLAGDFVGRSTYVRINSRNDKAVAQAGTALSMAKLGAIIAKSGMLLNDDGTERMKTLMRDSGHGEDPTMRDFSYFVRPDLHEGADASLRIRRKLNLTMAKIGFGPLKTGGKVRSELTQVTDLAAAGRSYIVAFQNQNDAYNAFSDVTFLVRRTIEIYESGAARSSA